MRNESFRLWPVASVQTVLERPGILRFWGWFSAITVSVLVAAPVQAKEAAADNYHAYCVQCHGMHGDGKGVNVRDMSVVPRDHTDAKAMSGRSDDLLFKAVKEGGVSISKSILMPPWRSTLTDEEIRDLVQYLRTLCKCRFGT